MRDFSLPSTRRWEIDALRGLMLVLMTLTHLPTRLTLAMGQPLGFVSAAEGFVLLSAYMAGLVYGRLAWRRNVADMRSAFLRRARKIYGCQVVTLLYLFTVVACIGVAVRQIQQLVEPIAKQIEYTRERVGLAARLVEHNFERVELAVQHVGQHSPLDRVHPRTDRVHHAMCAAHPPIVCTIYFFGPH